MAFMWLRKRKNKLLVFASVLLALFAFRHLQYQEGTPKTGVGERSQLPEGQKHRYQSMDTLQNGQVFRFAQLLLSDESGNTSQMDKVFKVVEAGTNVKVPGLEIYVVSAIFHPQHRIAVTEPRPTPHSNSKKEEGTKTAEQHTGKEPGDDKADANGNHVADSNSASRCGQSKLQCPERETTKEKGFSGKTITSKVYFTTWTDVQTEKIDVKFCCVFVSSQKPHDKMYAKATRTVFSPPYGINVTMTHAEYECKVSSSQLVEFVAFAHQNCSGQISPFLAIEHTDNANVDVNDLDEQRVRNHSTDIWKEPTVAVCLPALYGRLPVQPLVEWLELQRLLGVSRVHIHYTELHDETMSVITMYQQQGLVTFRPFVPAARTGDSRRGLVRNTTRNNFQAWADAWVMLNECRRRLYSYTIVMVLDHDEILIPQAHLSLPSVFQKALARHPNAAYFFSHAFIHLYDWGISYPNTSVSFLQYLTRTSSNLLDSSGEGKSSPKTFFVPSRIKRSVRLVHWPKEGYKSVQLGRELVTLHHYRHCKRRRWADKCVTWKRVTDNRELLWLQYRWEPAVKGALKHLNESTLAGDLK